MSNKQNKNISIEQAHERLFAKYGMKTTWVEKTGCGVLITNRQIKELKKEEKRCQK